MGFLFLNYKVCTTSCLGRASSRAHGGVLDENNLLIKKLRSSTTPYFHSDSMNCFLTNAVFYFWFPKQRLLQDLRTQQHRGSWGSIWSRDTCDERHRSFNTFRKCWSFTDSRFVCISCWDRLISQTQSERQTLTKSKVEKSSSNWCISSSTTSTTPERKRTRR